MMALNQIPTADLIAELKRRHLVSSEFAERARAAVRDNRRAEAHCESSLTTEQLMNELAEK